MDDGVEGPGGVLNRSEEDPEQSWLRTLEYGDHEEVVLAGGPKSFPQMGETGLDEHGRKRCVELVWQSRSQSRADPLLACLTWYWPWQARVQIGAGVESPGWQTLSCVDPFARWQ